MKFIYSIFIVILILSVLPLMALAVILIVMDSGIPVIYRQKRIGLRGKVFTMYKFRTMIAGAEIFQKKYQVLNQASGPVFKIRNDPRFTKIGRFLSHTGLDELPQLFNVLKGEMALIGPRPLPVGEAKKLLPWMRQREKIKPGIISPWVLEGYHRNSFTDWMKSDIKYAESKSFSYDAILALRSLVLLLGLITGELTGGKSQR